MRAARLESDGFARRTTGAQRAPHYDDGERAPLADTRHQRGWYTEFGAIDPLVADEDHALAIFGPGEAVVLDFEAPPAPVADGMDAAAGARTSRLVQGHGSLHARRRDHRAAAGNEHRRPRAAASALQHALRRRDIDRNRGWIHGQAERSQIRRRGNHRTGPDWLSESWWTNARAARPTLRLALPPVIASWDRIIRTTVGLRPHRPAGFNVSAEKLDDKTVIHNYGHGGAGHSLGWGSGSAGRGARARASRSPSRGDWLRHRRADRGATAPASRIRRHDLHQDGPTRHHVEHGARGIHADLGPDLDGGESRIYIAVPAARSKCRIASCSYSLAATTASRGSTASTRQTPQLLGGRDYQPERRRRRARTSVAPTWVD